jgi:hypothetical protein
MGLIAVVKLLIAWTVASVVLGAALGCLIRAGKGGDE